jgi:hypothetical protein
MLHTATNKSWSFPVACNCEYRKVSYTYRHRPLPQFLKLCSFPQIAPNSLTTEISSLYIAIPEVFLSIKFYNAIQVVNTTRDREEFHVLEDVHACLEVLRTARLIAVLRTSQLTTGILKTELAHSYRNANNSRRPWFHYSFLTGFAPSVFKGDFVSYGLPYLQEFFANSNFLVSCLWYELIYNTRL